ncbi:5-formyltetrahydrofolate cyclo-ligase [Helicobacter sp. MIT 99-5507]|uniref:5-formyltetrahydrofolate cyclo-ligase n=1 Tax=Helicobacter sp. MIT 99-5507 TaxID=152489 RepID=UPI000E1E6F76|nr:5-formyltetrahydrofolate cyclo-ligase [Helicobacter sp. MIT 99-5507]RDU58112.1 5-formyltetrahydrofolate cyclo-ligase [Helicobacter sp. MIT 99-5507]
MNLENNKENLKKEFRKFAKKDLFSLSKNKEIFNDKKVTKQIEKIIFQKKAKNILLYTPMNSEVNIFPLINTLRKTNGIRIFLPFITGESFKIVPFRLPLRKNKYNIFETKNSKFFNFNKIDLAVVPILGVDVDFKRIGFGKGMYDRFYNTLKKKPYNIFVCRILNFAILKIGDSYDIVGDTIISTGTRKGNYDFLGNNWFYCRWNFIRRICIFNNKKSIHLKPANSFKASKNKSNCNRKRS